MASQKPKAGTAADRLAERIGKIESSAGAERIDAPIWRAHDRAARSAKFRDAIVKSITGEAIQVVVKDISATGARIEFKSHLPLPDRLFLSEPTIPICTWAYVVWQRPGVAGLEYVRGNERQINGSVAAPPSKAK